MRSHHRRYGITLRTILFWVGMGLTTAVLGHAFRVHSIETRIVGVAQPVGYTEQAGWIQPGNAVRLIRDAAMPEGFERIYVDVKGERLGFLPEPAARQGIRTALREGILVKGAITAVDGQDPAHGVTIRITVGS